MDRHPNKWDENTLTHTQSASSSPQTVFRLCSFFSLCALFAVCSFDESSGEQCVLIIKEHNATIGESTCLPIRQQHKTRLTATQEYIRLGQQSWRNVISVCDYRCQVGSFTEAGQVHEGKPSMLGKKQTTGQLMIRTRQRKAGSVILGTGTGTKINFLTKTLVRSCARFRVWFHLLRRIQPHVPHTTSIRIGWTPQQQKKREIFDALPRAN